MTWIELLRKAVQAEGSQAAVAARIGYSPAAVSQVLNGTYNGSVDAVRNAVQSIYGGKVMQPVPNGYKQNAVGHLVPIESIKEIDLARDEFVQQILAKASVQANATRQFKKEIQEDFQAFVDLSAERYGAALGGEKGNISLKSFDGQFEIRREVSETMEFDERLHVAKALVDECLREWTRDSDPKIRSLIENAFQVDKKGQVNIKRVLSLRKLKFDDEKWQRAMDAIGDALTITGSCTYFRFYERDDQGKHRQIVLDFSAA